MVIEDWRGEAATIKKEGIASYEEQHYLVKEETLPNGDVKLILKNKTSGQIVQRVLVGG